MDLRLMGNELVGKKFKTKVSTSGFSGEVHVWNKSRDMVIDEVFEHHVLCHHDCEDSGNRYRESFNVADLMAFGVIGKGKS